MTNAIHTLAAITALTVLAPSAFAQSAREIRGASPYNAVENEPAPKLIVDAPSAELLAQGVFQAQYRLENARIVQVFGPSALQVSPRLAHLHIAVDDLPWWWADASDNNTVDVAGLPPGQHKVRIELVNPNHQTFPGQVVTLAFTVPDRHGTVHDAVPHAHADGTTGDRSASAGASNRAGQP
jgi:hypothetical protein